MSSKPLILFDKPNKTYLSGETLSGRVVIQNTEPISARSIIINFFGITETWTINWCEPHCARSLFNRSQIAWISQDGKNILPPGKHEFRFATVLPECPPSFRGGYGHNRYEVEVVTDTPWWISGRVWDEFIITRKLDDLPVSYWEDKRWVWRRHFQSGVIFNEGPIRVAVYLPNLVYLPGETINVEMDIDNQSSTEIVRTYASFCHQVHYHSRHQRTPCTSFESSQCPLSLSCQRYVSKGMGKIVYNDQVLAAHNQGTVTIQLPVPMEAKTPSFASGLMTLGYCVSVGLRTKNSFWQCIYMSVYIGERTVKVVKEEEKKRKGKEITKEEEQKIRDIVQEALKEQKKTDGVAPPAYIP
ncbi:hypothetical protein CAEBREN_22291 [Caenorhabditis brenneri]|uniref:Arrestin C-terminal-like domain-containing protein n=1 Tax=Caenorhabditis brenneri TaxID=135651 RepID=G0PL43_CAEBE|nr:hypothetical protein CAEBREN_22291 [Caenorhabditis brenneri]